QKQSAYLGKRVKRGLFKSAKGILLNADCNGSANIIRKVFPNAFANGITSVTVTPVKVLPFKVPF
ncbi:MAG: RNA-guided endonuclease TnpB family protein, partial [Sphaerospermopsis kisseleviana]